MGPRRWNKFSRGGTNLSLEGPSTVAATSPLSVSCFKWEDMLHTSHINLFWSESDFPRKPSIWLVYVGTVSHGLIWSGRQRINFPICPLLLLHIKYDPEYTILFQTMNVNIWIDEWMNEGMNKLSLCQHVLLNVVLRFWKLLWKSRNWDSGDNLKLEIAEGARSRAPKTE